MGGREDGGKMKQIKRNKYVEMKTKVEKRGKGSSQQKQEKGIEIKKKKERMAKGNKNNFNSE